MSWDVVRSANNEVHLFADLYNTGTWVNYYLPRTRARIQYNSNWILDWTTVAPSSPTAHALFERYYNLQQTGVGLYRIEADHWSNSAYCEGFGYQPIHYYRDDQETILRPERPDYGTAGNLVFYLGNHLGVPVQDDHAFSSHTSL